MRLCSYSSATLVFKGVRKGVGLTPTPFTLISYKNFITCEKKINSFGKRLRVNLST